MPDSPENSLETPVAAAPPKPRWRELILYLLVGFGLYFAASIPLVFLLAADPKDVSIGFVVAVGFLNAACLIGTVYLTGIRRGRVSWRGLGFWPVLLKVEWVLLAVLVSLMLMPVRSLIGAAAERLINGSLDSLQMRGNLLFAGAEPTWGSFLISLFIIGVLVPISEELYFRGLLYRWFQLRFRFWPAVLLSSLIFGLAHYDSLAVVISSFVLGAVCAIAMERTKSIWVPIILHSVTNSAAVTLVYLALFLEPYLGTLG